MSCKRHHLRRGGSGQWSRISRHLAPSSSSSGSGRPHRRQADPSPADHEPAPGSPTRSNKPPHTYLRSLTPSMEEAAARRQKARGRNPHLTKIAPSIRHPRGGTPTNPSPLQEAPARRGWIRENQKADHAGAAPTQTPPAATNLHTLFTSRTPDPGFSPSSAAALDGEEEGNHRRRRRERGERKSTLKCLSRL